MKNFIILILFLISIVSLLFFKLYQSNKEVEINLFLNSKITKISQLNTDLLIFTRNHNQFKNYDLIDKNINDLDNEYSSILKNKDYTSIQKNSLYKKLLNIKTTIYKQVDLIQKQKSYDAVYNNSIRNIQKIKSILITKNFEEIYNIALTLDFDKNIYDDKIKNLLSNFEIKSQEEALFIKHVNIIFEYYLKKHDLINEIENLNLQIELKNIANEFEIYSIKLLKDINYSILFILLILLVLIISLIYYIYTVLKTKIELEKLKKALDISDNIILITDINHKIKYVNHGFEKTTGYTKEEVIGKTPAFLNSGKLDDNFYRNLHDTIHNGEEWNGELINRSRDGEITVEKSSITPIKNEKGEIVEFLAIKLNITKEKEYQDILLQQSKMASMGELLENISHQWRQPLSIISSVASSKILQIDLEQQISNEALKSSYNQILETSQKLSNTIDDLKNFFNKDDELISFNIKETLTKSLHLFNMKLQENNINITIDSENVLLSGKEKELIQVLINIFNNSLDAFELKRIENRYIKIKTKKTGNNLFIEIADNAGGIDPQIISKVFDLYFTTKHKYGGTGIGLYMVYQIITHVFKGKVTIKNQDMLIGENEEKGTLVTIFLPIS